MASAYNETVAVNLNELELGLWHLLILTTSHASVQGVNVTTKSPKEIVKHFIHC